MKELIIGYGKTGQSILDYLNKKGRYPLIFDEHPEGIDQPLVKGPLNKSTLQNYQNIFVSPGIDLRRFPDLQKKDLSSDIEIAFADFPDKKYLAITGTNGKSTTVRLASDLLKSEYSHTQCVGNIGTPILSLIHREGPFVIEMSSFQIDLIRNFRASVNVMMNVTSDHMDRYDKFEDYVSSKARLLMNASEDDFFIYNMDDPIVENIASTAVCKKMGFSLYSNKNACAMQKNGELIFKFVGEIYRLPTSLIKLQGRHNLYNVMAAVCMALQEQVPWKNILRVVEEFKGLPHRMEFVRTVNEISFYNDSKATNIGALKSALQCFKRKIILIAGGEDKGADFKELVPYFQQYVKKCYLIGPSASRLKQSLQQATPISICEKLAEAVQQSASESDPNDIVLLCPGCASFDQFKNFEERGVIFKQAVVDLI